MDLARRRLDSLWTKNLLRSNRSSSTSSTINISSAGICGGESSLFSSASSFNFAGILFLPPIKAGIEILKSRDFLRFLDFRFLGEDLDGDLEGDLDGEGAGEGECLPLPTDSS